VKASYNPAGGKNMQPKENSLLKQLERPFWQLYLFALLIVTLLVFIGAVILGDLRQMTNLYFWSTLFLFLIAALPIFFEIGTSAKIAGKAIKDGEEVGSQLKEKQETFNRGARITYLFGALGISTFILAVLTLVIR
jgi:hypothetical protein